MSSANAFNFDQFKMLLFGKELKNEILWLRFYKEKKVCELRKKINKISWYDGKGIPKTDVLIS